jgi:hypothetical protein
MSIHVRLNGSVFTKELGVKEYGQMYLKMINTYEYYNEKERKAV